MKTVPKHPKAAIGLAVLAIFLATPNLGLAQNCDAVLAGGVFDTNTFSDNSTISNALHHHVCSNRTRQSGSNSTFGVNLPLPDLASALGFNTSSEINRESIDQYCQSGRSVQDYQAAVNVLREVASQPILDSWKACMAKAGGLNCETSLLGSGQFSVTLSWRRQNTGAGTQSVTITGAPQLANAICPGDPIKDGAIVLDVSSLTEFCQFSDSTQPATVALNTTQGAVQCRAEAAVPKSEPVDAAQACGGGDDEACLEVIRLSRSALEVCERTGTESNFTLYIQCGNATVGISQLMTKLAAVDQACWRDGGGCASARQSLAGDAAVQGKLVEAILTGGSFLGPTTPSFQ